MKVLYDFQAFDFQDMGGVSNCFCQLIKHLPKEVEWDIAVKESNNIHLKESQLIEIHPKTKTINSLTKGCASIIKRLYYFIDNHFPFILGTSRYQNMSYSLKKIKESNFDILHATFFDTYFINKCKKPFVITVHDLVAEKFNIFPSQIKGRIKQLEKCNHVVVVSENTKRDLMDIYNIPENKISVIYHGFNPSNNHLVSLPLFDKPYLLYVGDRSAIYKNFEYFVKESSRFLALHRDFVIVCTGKEFSIEEMNLFKKYEIGSRVFHHFCSNTELNNLYSNAYAFVYPSLYEGFGMPILEAFDAKCPVILNNKSCFPEIAKDGALFFDSDNDSLSLYNCLEMLFTMPEYEKNNLLTRATNRLSDFSWEKASLLLSEVYKKVQCN